MPEIQDLFGNDDHDSDDMDWQSAEEMSQPEEEYQKGCESRNTIR